MKNNIFLEKCLKKIQDDISVSSSGMINPVDSPSGVKIDQTYKPLKQKNKNKEIIVDEQESNKFRYRVLIDFDGVIHKYDSGYNDEILGETLENVKEAIDNIRNSYGNLDILIFTTRACSRENENYLENIEKIKEYLDKYDIYYDDIIGEKVSGLIYVDDNSYRFSGSWLNDLPEIKRIIEDRIIEISSRGM